LKNGSVDTPHLLMSHVVGRAFRQRSPVWTQALLSLLVRTQSEPLSDMGANCRGLAASTTWNSQAWEEGGWMESCLAPADMEQANSQAAQGSRWSGAELVGELLLL